MLIAPADSPKTVTLAGSPPKAAMLSRTHSRAATWSSRPRLAVPSLQVQEPVGPDPPVDDHADDAVAGEVTAVVRRLHTELEHAALDPHHDRQPGSPGSGRPDVEVQAVLTGHVGVPRSPRSPGAERPEAARLRTWWRPARHSRTRPAGADGAGSPRTAAPRRELPGTRRHRQQRCPAARRARSWPLHPCRPRCDRRAPHRRGEGPEASPVQRRRLVHEHADRRGRTLGSQALGSRSGTTLAIRHEPSGAQRPPDMPVRPAWSGGSRGGAATGARSPRAR